MVSVTLDCYLTGALWKTLDPKYFPHRKAGRDVDMVNRHPGVVRGFPGSSILK